MLTIYQLVLPVLFLPYILWEAEQDYKAIVADGSKASLRSKWHRQSANKTLLVIVALCVPLLFLNLFTFHLGVVLLCFEFWLCFDMLLNKKRGKGLFYVGYTAATDKFFRRFNQPELVMLLVKSVGILITMIFYYGQI
ncbi:hypothetical protein [Adhaeribacter aquaticus]|uniref:hypothetical protein n=1 Tax=Adhaeribacter aquaticus TaxID=299567 RepID=UPI00041198C8|nr:hypothetical protein [Adhaeribacter aquaticus]